MSDDDSDECGASGEPWCPVEPPKCRRKHPSGLQVASPIAPTAGAMNRLWPEADTPVSLGSDLGGGRGGTATCCITRERLKDCLPIE